MWNLRNIYKWKRAFAVVCGIIIIVLLIGSLSCSLLPKRARQARVADELTKAEEEYDPLKDPRDKIILEQPEQTEAAPPIAKQDDFNWARVDSFMQAQNLEDSTLTVYRIQLFASQYYTEAHYELQIAEKVFVDSVFMKYELPYYKVLLGNTTDENAGRRLLSQARALGYANSWLIESEPDSIYYRALFIADSIAALDSLKETSEAEIRE
jgi:hypothetical protein